jgi:type IV secretion system protein VirD4
MSPSASAAVSPPSGSTPRAQRRFMRLRALALGIGALVLAQYLAGWWFLLSHGMDPRSATPLTITRYAYYYGEQVHVRRSLMLSLGGSMGLMLASAAVLFMPRRPALHGEARFATRREIARRGLLGEEGIILGRWNRRCIMLAGQQGVALAAPPRSGKGVGIVVPNALNWPGSMVCVDIKKENWALTAGFRAKSQPCFLFDPFAEDGRTARWNPFFYVAADPRRRVNDLQRIAEMLYPDPPNVDPFWTASARSLFLGIALYLFETPSLPRTIGEVLRQGMASDDEGFGQHWKRLIEGRNSGRYPMSGECVRSLYDVIDLAPVTASSIRKTFTSRLDLWLNPMLDAATSGNDFDLRQLRERPMSIYVGVNPDDLHRLRPVLSLFFQQAIGLQTRELPERSAALKHQVMMLLDEFTALGRIPIIAEAISYLPGYNVRVVLVIQTPAQLREVYGANAAETMLKSLAARIVFTAKDMSDAREISEELGYTTVKVKSLSRPRFDLFDTRARRSRSETVSEQRRALLLPQEVKELGSEEAIIFYEGLRPIRCGKLRYHEDRCFRARLSAAPEVPALACAVVAPAALGRTSSLNPQVESAAVAATAQEPTRTRAATIEDLKRVDTLTLEDFDADFSRLNLPTDRRPTKKELEAAAKMYLECWPAS